MVHYHHHWFIIRWKRLIANTLRTVDKAAELLGYFSERRPEIGLSDLARIAGFDKATTRRLLLALIKHDYIEQNPESRAYRLGPGVIRLAKVRETAVPLDRIIPPLLKDVVAATGETAHFSLVSGATLTTVHVENSPHSNRIHFVLGEEGPMHATASGLVCLAFGPDTFRERTLESDLAVFTDSTLVNPVALLSTINTIKTEGFYLNHENYERHVCSVAAPVINTNGFAIGAIAVAAPSSRFDADQQTMMREAVCNAAKIASHSISGNLESAH